MTTILVIEDETNLRENIRLLLQLEGYETVGAGNGVEGVEVARKVLPDFIICDVMMPKLDGYGVLMELQNEPATATIPFLFLTARAEHSDRRQGMELGADDYLTKPFDNDDLLAAIQSRIKKHTIITQHQEQQIQDLQQAITTTFPHELRTPLTAILGYASFLVEGIESFDVEQLKMFGEGILKAGNRLHRLIENYILYAQLEFTQQEPERFQQLQNVLRQKPAFPAKSIEILATEKAAAEDRHDDVHLNIENAQVFVPEQDVRKIAEELIDNALKFSKAGTPIHVNVSGQNGHFSIEVSDEGRGMSLEEIKNINAYIQFDRKIHEQQGAGLGLIIARRMTELFNGTLDFESQVGVGTKVTVSLPG
jgi:signal transduction histidine kinase